MQVIKEAGAIAKTVAISLNPRVELTMLRKLLGIHDLLPKPYTRRCLLAVIQKLAPREETAVVAS